MPSRWGRSAGVGAMPSRYAARVSPAARAVGSLLSPWPVAPPRLGLGQPVRSPCSVPHSGPLAQSPHLVNPPGAPATVPRQRLSCFALELLAWRTILLASAKWSAAGTWPGGPIWLAAIELFLVQEGCSWSGASSGSNAAPKSLKVISCHVGWRGLGQSFNRARVALSWGRRDAIPIRRPRLACGSGGRLPPLPLAGRPASAGPRPTRPVPLSGPLVDVPLTCALARFPAWPP